MPDHTHLNHPWQVVNAAAARLTECNHSPGVRTLDAQHAGNGHCAGGGEEPRPAWQQRAPQPGAARRLAPRACSARSVDSCLAWPTQPARQRRTCARTAPLRPSAQTKQARCNAGALPTPALLQEYA